MADPVALLLADRSPSLRYRALVEVDGQAPSDPEVVQLREQIAPSEDVRRLSVSGESPRELSYALCRLAYLGLRRGDEVVDLIAERLLGMQKRDGSWARDQNEDGPRRRGEKPPPRYQWVPLQTALPLRGLAATGFAEDPRSERAFEWLLSRRLDDGSWPQGLATGATRAGAAAAGYRKLPRSEGCRTNTTGVLACLAHHPTHRRSDEARAALDILLRRETRDEWTLGFEVSRLMGAEAVRGFFTFYARFDLAFLLDIASRCGASLEDLRVADLVEFLLQMRGPHGLWEHRAHPHLNRWLTLDLMSSLRRLESGDWTGSDLRVGFQAYPRQRRRH